MAYVSNCYCSELYCSLRILYQVSRKRCQCYSGSEYCVSHLNSYTIFWNLHDGKTPYFNEFVCRWVCFEIRNQTCLSAFVEFREYHVEELLSLRNIWDSRRQNAFRISQLTFLDYTWRLVYFFFPADWLQFRDSCTCIRDAVCVIQDLLLNWPYLFLRTNHLFPMSFGRISNIIETDFFTFGRI